MTLGVVSRAVMNDTKPFCVGRARLFRSVPVQRLSPVDPSFRALYGRLKFTIRGHKFNKDSLSHAPSPEQLSAHPARQRDWDQPFMTYEP